MRKPSLLLCAVACFVLMVALAIYISVVHINLVQARRQRAAAPLPSYAQTHWFDLGERGWVSLISPRSPNGPTEVYIWAGSSEKGVTVYAERLGYQKWRLRGNNDVTDWRVTAKAFGSHVGHQATDAGSALKLVREFAASDPQLLQVVVRRINGKTCFCFWSQRARGTYAVFQDDMCVYFLLKEATVIP
jgi:hypothetical protein